MKFEVYPLYKIGQKILIQGFYAKYGNKSKLNVSLNLKYCRFFVRQTTNWCPSIGNIR